MRVIVVGFLALWAVLCDANVRRYSASSSTVQCKDEEGNNVDWYVVYKFPRDYDSSRTLLDGVSYMYITSKTVERGWKVSSRTMENDTNIIMKTIANMYKNKDEEMWLMYNDQFTDDLTSWGWYEKYGHTKGVVGANSKEGFWLVHSIPHFPSLDKYVYPHTAFRFGQSALCISMTAAELDKVGDAFKYNVPDFAKKTYSSALGAKYPKLKLAAEGEEAKTEPWNTEVKLKSKGGVEFRAFAKGRSFGKDLYEWVASALGTDLYAETWRLEEDPLPPSCSSQWKVMNVQEVSIIPAKVDFINHKDHSKWASSSSSSKPYVCVGDINRAGPQERRGGGTVCLSNNKLWKAYNDIIGSTDSCDTLYGSSNNIESLNLPESNLL